MQVVVKNGNVERAMRTLKKKLQKEGLLKELKQRQYFEKPSAKKARKKAEGVKRYQRNLRKKNGTTWVLTNTKNRVILVV